MELRKGKTRTILKSAIDVALLAVEVYNKPRTTFRCEDYIILMIIAWTRLFHAYFYHEIGDKYYYKKKGSVRYKRIDGERKAWELARCIRKYGNLREPIKKNLEFFIGLRNKIEHRHVDKKEFNILIFGECQTLLYNFENTLIELFSDKYALHESLVYNLQFSHLRTKQQESASKAALSKDLQNLINYVEKFRSALSDEIFSSQEYSIKLLQIPRISNTNRNDLAIEFVRWDELNAEDKEAFEKITSIIKDKTIRIEATNVGQLKPKDVIEHVNNAIPGLNFHQHAHMCLWKLFRIRPPGNFEDPFNTNTKFCHYDEAHDDYVYQTNWSDFVINLILSHRRTMYDIHTAFRNGEEWNIQDYV